MRSLRLLSTTANGPRPCPNRFFTCLFSRRGGHPSTFHSQHSHSERSEIVQPHARLHDQPSRRRPISLIDHTQKKDPVQNLLFFSHMLWTNMAIKVPILGRPS